MTQELDPTALARALAARRRVVGEGKCEQCGAPIVIRTPSRFVRRFCSRRCWQRYYWQAHKAEKTEYQRRYRARRQQQQAAEPPPGAAAACEVCGKPFTRVRRDRRFCSPRCQVKAWYRAHRRQQTHQPPQEGGK
jgi:endogenous inhibitor of DNA gyrase (YacG/DUF329 family)